MFQDQLFETARFIRRTEEVQPIAFVFGPMGEQYPMPLAPVPYDQWDIAIRQAIRMVGGVGVIVHTEAWGNDNPESVRARIMNPMLRANDLPGHYESLQSVMELQDGTVRVLNCRIVDGQLSKTVAHEDNEKRRHVGRMIGFFANNPPEDYDA